MTDSECDCEYCSGEEVEVPSLGTTFERNGKTHFSDGTNVRIMDFDGMDDHLDAVADDHRDRMKDLAPIDTLSSPSVGPDALSTDPSTVLPLVHTDFDISYDDERTIPEKTVSSFEKDVGGIDTSVFDEYVEELMDTRLKVLLDAENPELIQSAVANFIENQYDADTGRGVKLGTVLIRFADWGVPPPVTDAQLNQLIRRGEVYEQPDGFLVTT